jgi:DNA invertase Pin-like site-specific DNA recombinase
MNVGYVRLSKDDDKRNYVSIENQKLIISQYAAEQNMTIDRWYEDDGVSGYIFDRPGFNQLMNDLDSKINTIIVKDFSRLGRHNAKVLLLLDEFQEKGKQFIAIDDHYDSLSQEDDTIGITTWFNERYVKDTSKKIRHAISARQIEGTLAMQAPFGYKRNKQNKDTLEIVPKEAECIKLIYELYLKGSGYRKIANYLTENQKPTPSMIRHERELNEGHFTKYHIATVWSDGMVKDILDNDVYTGVLRLHKRERLTIHGKDKRISKSEQYVFENHHEPIIDKMTYDLVQELKSKRIKNNYRGSRGQWLDSEIPNPFSSCLYCKDCGCRLTPIIRKNSQRERKYYICSTYNRKGKKYCAKAHLIEEKDLMHDVVTYICLCRNALSEILATYDIYDFESERKSVEEKKQTIQESIAEKKNQLKVLYSQRIKDIAASPNNTELISESYEDLIQETLASINGLDLQLEELKNTKLETPDIKQKLKTALDIVDNTIQTGNLSRKDIELLVERITIDENSLPHIELKYGLSNIVQYNPLDELNCQESEIIFTTMQLILDDVRSFTSAKYLAKHLTLAGYKKTTKSVLTYIDIMIDMGILEPTDIPTRPYNIVKSKAEIREIMKKYKNGTDYGSMLHCYNDSQAACLKWFWNIF